MLDPTELRILGVLIEKELSVPESYPMTENALLAGCNQKNNREPPMALEAFQVAGALTAMRLAQWVVQIEGGRARRFRHRVGERLALDNHEKAVLAELILRGPQAPGALKPRVARMGFEATPDEIEAVLVGLRDRPAGPLVELLGLRPRERDRRWAHRLGAPAGAEEPAPSPVSPADPVDPASQARAPATASPAAAPATSGAGALEPRLARLEAELAALRAEVAALRARLGGEAGAID